MVEEDVVFLVQAPAARAGPVRRVARMANVMPPLGLLSIAAYLEESGYHTRVFDLNADPGSRDDLLEGLRGGRPVFLGISAVTASFNGGVEIARLARSVLPEVKIIFGGPHVSALREKILQDYPVIDAVVVGEGEKTFGELLDAGMESAERVKGLVYRDDTGEVRFSGERQERLEVDSLPYPAYHRLHSFPDGYRPPLFTFPRLRSLR
ncbi:MAG: B12-binding domain-containing radical SAM protein [Planctomycetota bacterium]